ncbi:unnamed protein product [Spirodela intermedia]|uniref:Uncharacterized protein n=1 Tax=Spirodela intermedia TaxID=51605 RepID=A0A7I8LF10_SPIIN|nr:unnamed protein product [Spirodela intermedia]
MAAKPLTTEAIALTEKKMDMSLDDIIKMSKKNSSNGKKPPRISNKSRGFSKPVAPQRNSSKAQRFTDSRVLVRQGVLAQKRTNFRSNQFPLTTEVARKAQVAPIRNRGVNWHNQRVAAAPPAQIRAPESSNVKENAVKPRPQTLDALFANMKQQRMRAANQQVLRGAGGVGGGAAAAASGATNPQRWRGQQLRGRGGGFLVGATRRLVTSTKRY